MNKQTIEMYQTGCDKCCGSGKVFAPDVDLMIKHWRTKLGLSRKTFAALAKIPYTTYCKFENGRITFGESRLRKIVEILRIAEENNV